MKSVMISIKPKWCKLIESGKKTIEVRKTKPKCDVPFKCYIYCTTQELLTKSYWNGEIYVASNKIYKERLENNGNTTFSGKVIGEFVCNCITPLNNLFVGEPDYHLPHTGECCLSVSELEDYGKGKRLYGWHISDLKIYDKPKELSEFHSGRSVYEIKGGKLSYTGINRPPQSWMYVEVADCQSDLS